jgi:methyltransferase-like protein
MRGMVRDILLYASRDAEGPGARLEAAQAALTRLETAIAGLGALSTRYLCEEIAALRKAPPSYLLFEYLAEHNQAFLFSDFAADCERQGLKYLCDTDLRTGFPSSYGKAVEAALAPIEDGVELEQWLDFVTNRNFRQSLLCRSDAKAEDAIDLDQFANFAFCADLKATKRPDLRRVKEVPFATPAGVELKVVHPLTKALLPELTALYPDCLPLGELMPEAARAVAEAGGGGLASEVNECLGELFSLYAHRGIAARPAPLRVRRGLPVRPRVTALALAQVEAGAQRVATIHHGNLDLDSLAARLLALLDGTRTLDEVARQITDDLNEGRLPPPPGLPAHQRSRERLLTRSRAAVETLVALFARHGVLEPAETGSRSPS